MRLPNFFLVGVAKAGTTSLYRYLREHPQVYMSPIKGPTFFGAADLLLEPHRDVMLEELARHRAALRAYLDGPQELSAEHFVLNWDDYVCLFRDVRDELAVGEASTGYFWLPSAAATIRATLPDARIAVMLRDPAERLFSLYLTTLRAEPGVTFRAWFEATLAEPRRRAVGVEPGRYATHLERFFDLFPSNQLRVYLYEDYRADARAVLRDLFAFLGVNPDYPIDVSRRYNETTVPRFPRLHALRQRVFGVSSPTRWLPARARRAMRRLYHMRPTGRGMDPVDRHAVIDYHRDEIVRTARLLGRDLTAWLR